MSVALTEVLPFPATGDGTATAPRRKFTPSVPYSKTTVVFEPLAFTVPATLPLVAVTAFAKPVAAEGTTRVEN